jgi:hypothetical protein
MDAYTLRKIAPRILIGVIGINLSIYLCLAAIDVTNVVGEGLKDLIISPFNLSTEIENSVENNIAGAAATILGAVAVLNVAASGLAGLITILFSLTPIVLIALAIIITLVVRQTILILLTILSPIAIALFILPSTEKYFRQWWDLFVKTLMVYPIIAAIFATSTIMSSITLNSAQKADTGDLAGLANIITAIVFTFLPLFMIPFAFRFAGGALGTVMSAADNVRRNANERFGRWRQDPNSYAGKQAAKAKGNRYRRGVTPGQMLAGAGGSVRGLRRGPRGLVSGYREATGAIGTEHSMKSLQEIGEREAVKPIANNDDYLQALRQFTSDQDRYNYLLGQGYTEEGARQGAAVIRRADAVASRRDMKRFATINLPKTGTAFEGNEHESAVHQMNAALLDAADGDTAIEGNMMAMMRSGAQEGRRFDLVAGFGTNMRALEAQKNGASSEEVAQMVTDNSLFTQGPGAILGGRGSSVENYIPALQRRLNEPVQAIVDAHSRGDQAAVQAGQRELKQRLASTAGLLDVASQVSPENAEILANGLMSAEITDPVSGRTMTLKQTIDAFRGDDEFGEKRVRKTNNSPISGSSAGCSPSSRATTSGRATTKRWAPSAPGWSIT